MFARAWKCCIFDPILGPGGGFEDTWNQTLAGILHVKREASQGTG